jgi:tyrosine-protein kinase Etk/Wzc
VANEYLRQLDRSIYRFSRRKRQFVESQLTEQKAALRRAQQELQTFQSRHRAVALDAQAAEAVKALADLEAQRIQNRIALQQNVTALETMGSVDDLLRLRVEKEMLETKGQDLAQVLAEQKSRLADLPATMVELGRLTWQVGARQSVVEMLQRNYESARIGERDEEARYQVLDVAVPPEKPVRPRVLLNAAAAGLLGLVLALGWVLVAGGAPPRGRPEGAG